MPKESDLLIDAALNDPQSMSADVCVIGAGPAGIAVAGELAAAGAEVVVLEAGGNSYDRKGLTHLPKAAKDHLRGAQSMARGSTRGEPYFPLRMSRARGIGGSTNALMSHGLRSRPLDSVDFEARFGLPWPIEYDEFRRYLAAASAYCGIPTVDESGTAISWMALPMRIAENTTSDILAAPFLHGSRDAFNTRHEPVLSGIATKYVTSSVATGFITNGEDAVTGVEVRTLRGHPFTVKASASVLATGGIDNARLLLSSGPLLNLMGSSADHVGRYFMEHLHYVAAHLIPASPDVAQELGAFTGDSEQPRNWLTLSDEIVRDENLLRSAFAAIPVHETSLEPAVQAAGSLRALAPHGPFAARPLLRQAATALRGLPRVVQAAGARLQRNPARPAFALPVMSEQPPNPDSRVSLSHKRDRLGLPLPILDWRVTQREFDDARRSAQVLADEARRLDLGDVVSLWDRGNHRPTIVRGGWHHMGTTRMSRDPANGVVDQDCRAHGLTNLFVAGSSVFPTSGYANPTLSLVALAVRLGQHLTERLR